MDAVQLAEEARIDDEVGEGVPHRIDLDASGGGGDEGLAELSPDLVVLPDEGFEINGVLSRLDVGDHRSVEVTSEGEDLDLVIAHLEGFHRGGGEAVGAATPSPDAVEDDESCHRGHLGGNRSACYPVQDAAKGGFLARGPGHVLRVPGPRTPAARQSASRAWKRCVMTTG